MEQQVTPSTSSLTASPRWVDVLFARLQVRYGDAWTRKWEGIDERAVKADWERRLAQVYQANPKAIAHGLECLPDFPPTCDQFAALCRQYRAPEQPRLPKPAWAPEKAKEVAATVKAAINPGGDPLAGARNLRAREQAGDKSLTPAQREFWRTALRHEQEPTP